MLPRHGAGLRKAYRVHCTDSEVVGAAVDRDSLAIRVIADADELNRRAAEDSAAFSAASEAPHPTSLRLQVSPRCSSSGAHPNLRNAVRSPTHMLIVSLPI